MFRAVSLYLRRRAERKNVRAVLDTRKLWEQELTQLPKIAVKEHTLAIIRLDDIGDYLLYRNFLREYRLGKWAAYKITLIGNQVWKPLFERFDADTVDNSLWIDKQQYFGDEAYRAGLWQQLRAAGFSELICPSRTRPLLIDDMLALATGAPQQYAVANTYAVPEWNMISDQPYDRLFPAAAETHEFDFNRHFSNWITGHDSIQKKPALPPVASPQTEQVLCFIGASAKSKRWPLAYWISLVKNLERQGLQVLIAGGKQEQQIAEAIAAATSATSVAGKLLLTETLDLIGTAKAVVSGDTMAAHAAVAYDRPLVIIANGVNAPRFVDYSNMTPKAITLYTKAYRSFSTSRRPEVFMAVSSDMNTIKPESVAAALKGLL